jgi:AGCS family alanine or glycine:cation symporter
MQQIEAFLSKASGWAWGPHLLILLMGTHLFLTFRLGFIQRHLWYAIKLSFERKREGEGDVSHFGALMTALAATIGTGNIVGVATAVAMGGPGAVLWMWLTGVFGIATKYAEALLAVKYRVTNKEGQMSGGPMYALERGMNCRWLAVLFAAFTAIAAFGIGNMVQANSVADLMQTNLSIPRWVSGGVMTILTALVILGGIRSIARACEWLVPVMAVVYVVGCAFLLVMNAGQLPATIALIVRDAFSPQAAVGGFSGAGVMMAIRWGVARGLFSNESGLGSAPIVAAAAQTKHPVRQALVSSTGTFWDTVVVCAMTGLVVVNSGEWMKGFSKGTDLSNAAFNDFPVVGPILLTFGLLTFVFSTILGWCYYGEKAVEYLFGLRAIIFYRMLWVIAVMLGSLWKLQAVWDFSDIFNTFMAIPNLISLIALNGVLVRETRDYFQTLEEETPE